MERLTEKELYDGKVCFTKCAITDCPEKCAFCDIPREADAKLKEYEDMEEQGLLVKLPCKIGDVIYKVPSNANYGINIVNRHEENNRVYHQEVCRIEISSNGIFSLRTCNGIDGVVSVSFEETWFLTEDEAEAKLKELEELNKHLRMYNKI